MNLVTSLLTMVESSGCLARLQCSRVLHEGFMKVSFGFMADLYRLYTVL